MCAEAKDNADGLRNEAQVVRDMIRHEDFLTDHRTTWLLQCQGLLFLALAFAWDKSPLLVLVLSLLGIRLSLSIKDYLRLGAEAKKDLQRWWNQQMGGSQWAGPPIVGLADEDIGERRLGMLPYNIMPTAFAFAWACVIAIRVGESLCG